jgi:hypothetical protein
VAKLRKRAMQDRLREVRGGCREREGGGKIFTPASLQLYDSIVSALRQGYANFSSALLMLYTSFVQAFTPDLHHYARLHRRHSGSRKAWSTRIPSASASA